MKIQASAEFITLALSASKELSFRVYVRQTNELNLALSSGTWTEVTDRIDFSKFPDARAKVEYELGQFTVDSIALSLKGVKWWLMGPFSLASGYRLEVKVEFQIVGASDVIYYFSGWMDTAGSEPAELTDTISATVYSYDELGYRIPAERVTAQPIFDNVDGAGHDGLIMPINTNLYILDVNISGYEVLLGTHAIGYDPDQGVNLDGGRWQPITGSTMTIANGATAPEDTQKVQVHFGGGLAPPGPYAVYDEFVVTEPGQTLPRRWYKDVDIRFLLALLYKEVGIDDVTFDSIEFDTFDNALRLSYIDTPPNSSGIVTEVKNAIVTDGTNAWISVGKKLYKRDGATGVYTLKATVTWTIEKLFFNERNMHIWAYGHGGALRYDITGDSASSDIDLNESSDSHFAHLSVELVDYEYTSGSWKYALIATEDDGETSRGKLLQVDGSTLAVTSITTGLALGYTFGNGLRSKFMYQITGGILRFRIYNNSGLDAYREYSISGAGAWVDGGEKIPGIDDYTRAAAYNPSEARVYYYTNAGGLFYHTDSDATAVLVLNLPSSDGVIDNLYFNPNDDLIYFTADSTNSDGVIGLYTEANGDPPVLLVTGVYTIMHQLHWGLDRLFILDQAHPSGAIYPIALKQWHTKVVPNLTLARFKDASVTEMIKKTLNSFLLMGTVSFAKKALVFRRADDDGVPTTTGHTLAITTKEASESTEVINQYPKADLIQVNAQTKIVTYDGSAFDRAVLSNKRVIQISNDFIPDAIAKDLAVYAFKFFGVDRSLLRIRLGIVPLFQYEPFDQADISLSGTNIEKTASGPLYSVTCSKDGSLEVEALV